MIKSTTHLRPSNFKLMAVFVIFACICSSASSGTSLEGSRELRQGIYTVTLVTGDQVTLQISDGQRKSVTLQPADRDGSDLVTFTGLEYNGDVYVIPSDASAMIPDTLDRELFNVTKLIEYGFHEASGLPVVVTYYGPVAASVPAPSALGMTVKRSFWSIDAVAAKIDTQTAQLWNKLQRQSGASDSIQPAAPIGSSLDDIRKVWLDERFQVTLNESAPLVGAPQAWAEGYDGSGVTVAVLDTGVDSTHPDLANKLLAEANFSPTDTASDRLGHGTHVAGIAVGAGTASDGTYTGVAPGAMLLSGKTCDDQGGCNLSDLIAGMEWAASQGADIVNMSLTGGPTDGSDPLSRTLNRLSQRFGILFVVAAGNSGPDDQTVGSPGTADMALTVGAVDKESELARFSSRGPRVGDYAIKPDIAAPGVAIISARAQGNMIGQPINKHYMLLSGTSMSTPHVAGAAAILKQQQPEANPAELKALLVASATAQIQDAQPPGRRGGDAIQLVDIYEQGGGLLNIERALHSSLLVDPVPVNLGFFEYPQADSPPVQQEVTLANMGSSSVSLDVSLAVKRREDGFTPGPDVLNVAPREFFIQPGEVTSIEVFLDPENLPSGLYGGFILARNELDEILASIPIGFFIEPIRHTITINGINRNGDPVHPGGFNQVDVVDVNDLTAFLSFNNTFTDGVTEIKVPPGTYSVMGLFRSGVLEPDLPEEWTILGNPELVVDDDVNLTFDARLGNPVILETAEGNTEPEPPWLIGYSRKTANTPETFGDTFTKILIAAPTPGRFPPRFAAETETVSSGRFQFFARNRLVSPGKIDDLYELILVETDQISSDLRLSVRPQDGATLVNAFHSDNAGQQMSEVRQSFPEFTTFSFGVVRDFVGPLARREFVAGDTGTCHIQTVFFPGLIGPQGMGEPCTRYEPGELLEQTWYKSPRRPGGRLVSDGGPFGAFAPGEAARRVGDQLILQMREWVDTNPGHWADGTSAFDTTEFRLFQNGSLLVATQRAFGIFQPVPAGEYRLELDVRRDAPWWKTSTETYTAWTVQLGAPPPVGTTELVPIIFVDYGLDVDMENNLLPPRNRRSPPVIEIDVDHQPGLDGPPIEGARLWTSRDNGKSWRERAGMELGNGRFRFRLDNGNRSMDSGFLSLQVEAWDSAGNRIEQIIINAAATHDPKPGESESGSEE